MEMTDMKDGEIYEVGDIGNHYGGLSIRNNNGIYQWSIEDYSGHYWEDISESLVVELLKHEEKKSELKECAK